MTTANAGLRLLSVMKIAAEMRAAGAPWELVASKVGRSARAVRRWPERYRDDWDRIFRKAEDKLLAQVAGEAYSVLRKLLHSEQNWIGQNTGKFFYRLRWETHRESDPAAAPLPLHPKWGPYIAFLETMNDDEIRAFVTQWLAQRLAAGGAAVPSGSGPASAALAE